MQTRRRTVLLLGGAGLALLSARWLGGARAERATSFEIARSAEEWKTLLTPAQYHVLREHGTERPGTSALNAEKRKGLYSCAGCDLPLFSSDTKYESGTGWPSFYDVLPNAVGTQTDRSLLMSRTEVHCRRCGGHLGYVFKDGPKPTGLRYCVNGVALKFSPDKAA